MALCDVLTDDAMAEAVIAGLRWDFSNYERVLILKSMSVDAFHGGIAHVITEIPKWVGPDGPAAGRTMSWRHHMNADLIFVDGVSVKDRLGRVGQPL
jgi:hypothetical protein